MLSYRHAFHAGNFADLLKHIVQVEILAYLTQKDKPFDYIDTHAGAGLYSLQAEFASKNKEYLNGIGHWYENNPGDWPEIERYLQIVAQHNITQLNSRNPLQFYPGSPCFAAAFLRAQDKAWLFELHPADFQLLQQNFQKSRRIHLRQEDGFKALLALLPCPSRRALVMIDPSYEIKQDYEQVVDTVCKAHKKMPNAVFAIWYPVVKRARIERMQTQLQNSGIRNIQQFELGLRSDDNDFGMTSAGMIVINPPWTLMDKMQLLLPRLAERVTGDGIPHCQCRILVAE